MSDIDRIIEKVLDGATTSVMPGFDFTVNDLRAVANAVLREVRDAIDKRLEFGDTAASAGVSIRLWFDKGGKFEVNDES